MNVGNIATYLDDEGNEWAGQVIGREYAVGEIPPEKPGQPSPGARRVNTQRLQRHIVYVRSGFFIGDRVAGGNSVKPIQRLAPESRGNQRLNVLR